LNFEFLVNAGTNPTNDKNPCLDYGKQFHQQLHEGLCPWHAMVPYIDFAFYIGFLIFKWHISDIHGQNYLKWVNAYSNVQNKLSQGGSF